MNTNFENKTIVILGPTASGKTRLAAHIAYHLNGQIISADSRQVYRNMTIGTGKDYADYEVNGKTIPYHLIDMVAAGSRYHLHQYTLDFKKAFEQIISNKQLPIICGGTGLYIQAVLSDLSFSAIPVNTPLRLNLSTCSLIELQSKFKALSENPFSGLADLSTAKRCIRAIEISTFLIQNPNYQKEAQLVLKPFVIGLNPTLEVRRKRIADRLNQRKKEGLIEEVKNLLDRGISPEMLDYYGLEYKFVNKYLAGLMSETALFEHLEIAIQQFAKRQMTFFRKMEKDGLDINWIDGDKPFEMQLEQSLALIDGSFLKPTN